MALNCTIRAQKRTAKADIERIALVAAHEKGLVAMKSRVNSKTTGNIFACGASYEEPLASRMAFT